LLTGATVAKDWPIFPTIVILDEVPYGTATATPRVRLLGRPFSADQLITEVDQLLKQER